MLQADRHDELRAAIRDVAEVPKQATVSFRQCPAIWFPYVFSFVRSATGCSASVRIAQRTRSNVTTATRASRSTPHLFHLQPAKPGTQGIIHR